MAAETFIPVVDFSAYSLDRDLPNQASLQLLIDEVYKAFSTTGFVYLVNTGIPAETVKDAFSTSEAFFKLPLSEKTPFTRLPNEAFGFVSIECEGLNPDRPHKDLKEAFYYTPTLAKERSQKVDTGSSVIKSLDNLFTHAMRLHQRVLEVMAIGLKLEDPMIFVKAHKLIGKKGNDTCIRSMFYPPTTDFPSKEGQVRCGEHSDYGGITLLFQDSQGGLEVMNRDGDYIAAKPVEGSVIINVGDLMQRWTSDKLLSTKHRVLMPYSEEKTKCSRQSIAFFGHPDNEEQIMCIDGSNKYPPIGSREYLNYRYGVTY